MTLKEARMSAEAKRQRRMSYRSYGMTLEQLGSIVATVAGGGKLRTIHNATVEITTYPPPANRWKRIVSRF